MFAQADPAKAYKQENLVKSAGSVLNDVIQEMNTSFAGCMLVHERFDILRILEKV